MYAHLNLFRYFAATSYVNSHVHQQHAHYILFDINYCLAYFLFPLIGLITDVKTGRYKTIITGVYLSFVSWIIGGLSIIVKTYLNLDKPFLALLGFGYILQLLGYSCVRSNIVQFGIDQLIGASADELSAFIYWDFVSMPIIYVTIEIGHCFIKDFAIAFYIISGFVVSVVIISNTLFKNWLDTVTHIINPVRLIIKVFNYAWKNKYPRSRSAFTYWEENYPSRLDLGKQKYGGPFSEEQVENVKTVLQLTPLLLCIVALCCSHEFLWNSLSLNQHLKYFQCLVFNSSLPSIVTSILILFYLVMIRPFFYKYIPSMLRRIGLGLVFALLTSLSYIIMFACKEHYDLNTTSYKTVVIPEMLSGISFALIFPTSLEFTIAQSPYEIRGFMVGLWYAAFGVGYIFSINGRYPFKCQEDIICQNLYHYIFKFLIIFIILIMFLVLAKRYRLRVRENEVNIQWIAEEHHERYIDQEIEYRRELGLSFDSTNSIS